MGEDSRFDHGNVGSALQQEDYQDSHPPAQLDIMDPANPFVHSRILQGSVALPNTISWPTMSTMNRAYESEKLKQARLDKLEQATRLILEAVGEDPLREGLIKTPHRFSEALIYFTQGYEQRLEDLTNGALFEENHDELVIVKDIEIFSLCEHHLVPFYGRVHVGYIPDRIVLGLSKLARIAEMYARRLQVQERLTKQIATAINEVLKPQGVGVILEAS